MNPNKSKLIRSLRLKKNRQDNQVFVVEGKKSVLELLKSSFNVKSVVCSKEFYEENHNVLPKSKFEVEIVGNSILESLSTFKSSDSVLAIAKIKYPSLQENLKGLTLVLDGLSDPGNLGTIIRIADWFGIQNIIASSETVDFYNPKVLQASMGSFCRVPVHYLDLVEYLKESKIPIYGAGVTGTPVHRFSFPIDCLLVMGSESHGISNLLQPYLKGMIKIQRIGQAESLNVAVSAGILCNDYQRSLS